MVYRWRSRRRMWAYYMYRTRHNSRQLAALTLQRRFRIRRLRLAMRPAMRHRAVRMYYQGYHVRRGRIRRYSRRYNL